jgi:hypothetical protein
LVTAACCVTISGLKRESSALSYLDTPRLTFCGLFEADVNTINNDVRHYDVQSFEARFRRAQESAPGGSGTIYNGWWNPKGSNTFRLLHCRASGAVGEDGSVVKDDPALKLLVASQTGRTAAKLVDLDPQFQFASGIWGLQFSLTLDDEVLMSAVFRPACFRDIFFGRVAGVGGSPGASARFTGSVEEIEWGQDVSRSPFLALWKLMTADNDDRLSMSLMTYAYSKARGTEGFTLGSVIGSIGPWKRGEPLSFARGRRFAPAAGGVFASTAGFGYMNAAQSQDGTLLSVDFGNSFPMVLSNGSSIVLSNPGALQVAVLNDADRELMSSGNLFITPSAREGGVLTAQQFEPIGTLSDCDIDWLDRTGGIADFVVPEKARRLIDHHPLAILLPAAQGGYLIALRETVAGLWIRAEDFVQRIDAAANGWVRGEVTLYAMRFGSPYEGADVVVSLAPPDNTQGDAYPDQVQSPQAPIPTINVPADKFRFAQTRLTTGSRGETTLTYWAADPGCPRKYLDGQIYWVNYALAATGQSSMPMFEAVAVHVRDAFTPPLTPSWHSDIAPILVQFGNLYPIMSEGLFSFSDYETVCANAHLLYLAFTRDINDPEYMPATRDLSAGKRRMLVNWLKGFLRVVPAVDVPLPSPPVATEPPADLVMAITGPDHPTVVKRAAALAALKAVGSGSDGKAVAIGNQLRQEATSRTDN